MPMTFLTAGGLLHDLSETETREFARLCTDRRYPAGETIFSKGDPAGSLCILREGLVRLVSLSERGAETIHHLLKPGTIFGELLLSEELRAFTAVADSDVVISFIPQACFLKFLTSCPALSLNFIRLLSSRLTRAEKTFAEFNHTWSHNRLARTLLRLAEDHGERTPEGTVIGLRLTHEDLANLIGTARETVTTQMIRFRRMGLVTRQGRFLVVDKPRLEEFGRS
ncbi:MAG: Crp/Fnr family transcriptional regulator [Deltaproteobacteria bacterium]|nr:Crp/Fnr family transcriptional regulator [Deltaproteobacteria bacterium]